MNGLKQQIEKKLHACITDLFIEWHKEHPDDPYLHRLHSKIQILLDGYDIYPKGERVCIPRKQLEDLVMSEKKLAEFKNHPDVRTRNLYHFWRGYNSMLEKLLEESKKME